MIKVKVMEHTTQTHNNTLEIDDIVRIIDCPIYNPGDFNKYQNSLGKIIKIRHRYVGTPNEYKQFKVSFIGEPEGDDVTNLFHNSSLIKVSIEDAQMYLQWEKEYQEKQTYDMLKVGDLVQIVGPACYSSYEVEDATNRIGKISRVRHRYIGTPNEYKQYYVSFGLNFNANSINALYPDTSLVRL